MRIILVQQTMIRNNPEIITVGRVRSILRRNPTIGARCCMPSVSRMWNARSFSLLGENLLCGVFEVGT
ncbi:MAG: hypothetical protein ACJ0DH_10085 [bacterium]